MYPTVWATLNVFPNCWITSLHESNCVQQQQQKVFNSVAELCYTQDSRPAQVDGVDVLVQGVQNVPTGVANDVTLMTTTSVDCLKDKILQRIEGYDSKQNEKQTPFDDPKDAKIDILASTVASMQSTLMMLLEQQQKGTVMHHVPEKKQQMCWSDHVRP